jgi:uncharacterized protein
MSSPDRSHDIRSRLVRGRYQPPQRGPAVHSFGHFVDRHIDTVFKSSALIAAAAAAATIWALASNRWLLALLCAVVAQIGALGIQARFIEPFRLRVTRWRPERLLPVMQHDKNPFRVVFFADLHLGQYKRAAWAQRVVELTNRQKPDLVLIGGDFTGRVAGLSFADLYAPLAGLRATHGVYAVLGNHDYGVPGPDHSADLFALLPTLGIRVLRNEGVCLQPGVRLLGLDELWADGSDFERADAQCPDASGAGITLVLGHNPDALAKIAPEAVPNPARTLFLFGHTHGGQIRVPFMPGAAIPIVGDLYRGEFSRPQGAVYVSCGLGENTSPTRFGTTPEIVVFEI